MADPERDTGDIWPRPARVSVVVDTPGWFDPFADRLVGGHDALAGLAMAPELKGRRV